ncbi:MAG: hypothetical protein H7240_12975 [Glaciimonas sp.]|nr:hypothetical protein [Glaciimonas sp.]
MPVENSSTIKSISKTDVRKVRTVGVSGGRRFRAGIKFDQEAINVDFSNLNIYQVPEIEADLYLKVECT